MCVCVTLVTCECVCVALVAIAGRRYTYTVCTIPCVLSVSKVRKEGYTVYYLVTYCTIRVVDLFTYTV